MPKHKFKGQRGNERQEGQTWRERKQRILTHGAPSITESIADAVVAKNGNLFFLTQPDGSVPRGDNHGLGLYYHDCRFLKSYVLKLAGAAPTGLASSVAHGFIAVFELTNPDVRMTDGDLLRKEGVGIKWERLLDADKPALSETITFENFEPEPVEFPVTLSFDAGFEDVYAIRGLLRETPGKRHEPRWEDGALNFVYDGPDGIRGGIATFEPFFRYHTFADFSVNFSVITRAFTDQFLIKHEFIKRLHERYRREEIEIPFPIRTVHIKNRERSG